MNLRPIPGEISEEYVRRFDAARAYARKNLRAITMEMQYVPQGGEHLKEVARIFGDSVFAVTLVNDVIYQALINHIDWHRAS